MSLLPYGLRCQLSASTWASSVFWEHKFRLFFSSARRPDDKYDVIWDGDTRPPEHPEAWEYWNWLEGDAPDLVDQLGRRAGQLARETDPVTFRADDVGKLLGRLYKLSDGPRRRPRPPMPPPEPPPGERGGRTIEKLLIDCDRMRGTDHFLLRVAVRQLADRRHDKATAEEQDRYRGIIKEHRLLQEHKALDSSLQAELYAAVLGIAFEIPLDYEGYCQLEACAGLVPGQQMHRSLLRAVGKAGTDDLCTKLLVADGDGTISREKASSAELIEAVADRRLDVEHRRVIYETAVGELAAQARGQRFDWQLLRSALAEHAYLEPVLERIYRVPEVRLTSLRRLLKLAYGEVLTRADVHAVLSAADHPPSGDLFFAAVSMADRGDAEFAERRFIRELARGYHADTRGIFYRLFPEYDLRDDGDESPHPAWGSADVQHGLKQRITSWGQSKKPGSHAGPRPPVSQVPASRQRTDRPAPGPGLGPGLRINWVRVAYFLGALTMVFILTGLLVLFQVL
jgi:hypothetical protein